jgi:hypothetical protein
MADTQPITTLLEILTFDREMLKQSNEQLIAARDGAPIETSDIQTTVISL